MAKKKSRYVCQECGYESLKWNGKCSGCGMWNTLVEEAYNDDKNEEVDLSSFQPQGQVSRVDKIQATEVTRFATKIKELDRVLGGGIVPGSLILIGGAPGIGKSTLLLQISDRIASEYGRVLYISAEESEYQVKLRADRLKVTDSELYILAETNYFLIEKEIKDIEPDLVVVDSIQTIYDPDYDSAPGSVSQVRECAAKLMRLAKTENIPVFLVGHITKKGSIAGPKVLEHMVDTVLYFDDEQHHLYRVLRAAKNRFGSTNEIGIFEMKQQGLVEVLNPSQRFVSERPSEVSGSVIVASIEGSRPILVEVQALVSSANFGTPSRMTSGVDHKRVSLILAVLEKKVGLQVQDQDVYINIAGGMKVDEPGIDLGIAIAVISSLRDFSLADDLLVIGELGLSGEVRAVAQIERRIKEAKKLGFNKFLIPNSNYDSLEIGSEINKDILGISQITEVLDLVFGG
ncbi:DNA repair protein RadA [Fuchsiella alkaliacetigena]|uniref:DNA repair protein RadA n=1 Tax=Fuchsiella alkaliacetigena TaxID=957042 RepID=UPI00200A3EA6|nr:DNA repair protein RadA [Fuchsiella alkaliacetigena]MCK8825823.1 DNA repair protein RadA [Fuchsiella alkaliacetigena]